MEMDRVIDVLRALEAERVQYILVGGAAMNLHGLVRATDDVDLFLRIERDNIDRLRRALRRVWDDPEIDQIVFEDLAGEYPVVRYGPPDEPFVVDIMSRLGEAFVYDDLEAQEINVDGVRVLIATPATLYKMKRHTVRPIDRADAAAIGEAFGIEDVD